MKAMAIFGGTITILLAAFFSSILNGYALSVLWGWFMVPTFGVPYLSIPTAIGVILIATYLTHQIPEDKEEKEDGKDEKKKEEEKDEKPEKEENIKKSPYYKIGKGLGLIIFRPLFALLTGWIVQMFI